MYNLVIYNNNLELIKKFGNIIFNNFSNIHLAGIVSNEKELSYLCNKHKINMIILSLSDSKNNSLSQIFNSIENKIIICNTLSGLKSAKHILYISDSQDASITKQKLNKFLSNINDNIIRDKVILILEKFNFNFKLTGTNYLLDSIIYSYITKEQYLFDNLEKKIYPHISKKYNVSAKNIKWSIIRSINNMKSHLNISNFEDYYIDFPEKITPKFIISEIVNRL